MREALTWFKERWLQIVGAVAILVIVLLVAKNVGVPFGKNHFVAQLLILMALIYNSINTIVPLFKESLKGEIKDGLATAVALICSAIFFFVTIIHGYSLVLVVITNAKQIIGLDIKWLSTIITIWINLLFVFGGLMMFYIDLRRGNTTLARNVDLPFSVAVLIIFIFTLFLKQVDGGPTMEQYAIGIGSGGLAFQLIIANILAPYDT